MTIMSGIGICHRTFDHINGLVGSNDLTSEIILIFKDNK